MAITEIRLTPDNQTFSISQGGHDYGMRIVWHGTCWFLDLLDSNNGLIIGGIALITGADLLAQYQHLGLGFSLYVVCDDPASENPGATDLGITSHLYISTKENYA